MQPRRQQISLVIAVGLMLSCMTIHAVAVDVGETPTIKLRTTDNRTITSASVAGKLVVIHFWSMHSRPSIKAAPLLVELHKQHAKQGVQFVGVCMDRLTDAQAATVRATLGFSWFHVVESGAADDRLSTLWQVRSVPAAVLISPKGVVLWRGHPASLGKPLAAALEANPPRPVAMIDYEIAVESLQKADVLVAEGQFAEAFELLEGISPHIKPDIAMKKVAARITLGIRPDTSDKARQLRVAKTKFPDAITRLDSLRTATAVITPNTDGHTATKPITRSGIPTVSESTLISRLRLAERYAKAGNDIQAYDVYAWIVSKAGRSEIGTEAARIIARFEADPAFMARHKVVTEQRLANAQLAIAARLNELKQFDQARQAYQKVIDDYPRTVAAAKAQIQMEKLPKEQEATNESKEPKGTDDRADG